MSISQINMLTPELSKRMLNTAIRALVIASAVGVALQGCSSLAPLGAEHHHITGFQQPAGVSSQLVASLSETNSQKLNLYQQEHAYRKGFPQNCLSLSGGGVRSAWYSIGVMRALAKARKLDTLDVISATSGGSYALGWYYSTMLREIDRKAIPETGAGRDVNLFNGEAYNDLRLAFAHEYAIGPVGLVYDGFAGLLSGSLGLGFWLPFMALGAPPEDSLARTTYRLRIEKAFLHAPLDQNGINSLSQRLKMFAQQTTSYHLPIFIISATVQGNNTDRVHLSNAVFEYTPFFKGSDGTGYSKIDEFTTIGDAIATAGAAIDVPSPYGHVRNYSGITLGHAEGLYKNASKGSYYYLTDGGHSDNLALLPLVRRHCENIIVVDAEEDGRFDFQSYANLKKTLQEEYGAQLAVPRIDSYLDGIASIKNDVEPEAPWMPWNTPVSFGHICTLPVLDREGIDQRPINLTYLKLSFDASMLPFHGHETLEDKKVYDAMQIKPFPHYPTHNQYGISLLGIRGLEMLGFAHAQVAIEALSNDKSPEHPRNQAHDCGR